MADDDRTKKAPAPAKRRTVARRRVGKDDLERIVLIVRQWPSLPLTWELITDAVGREVRETDSGRKIGLPAWSRQALSKHAEIKKAYDTRRTELQDAAVRGAGKPKRARTPEASMLRNELEALRRENKDLKERLAEYEEKFATMVHNKTLGAKTEDSMVVPLKPKMDRLGRDG